MPECQSTTDPMDSWFEQQRQQKNPQAPHTHNGTENCKNTLVNVIVMIQNFVLNFFKNWFRFH